MNIGWADVTFAAGVGTATWQNVDYVKGGADNTVLDDVPQFSGVTCSLHDQVHVGVIMWTFTQTGVRGVSSHLGDTSKWRVWAAVKFPANLYLGQR